MTIVFNGVRLGVAYTYYKAARGHRDQYGAPEEPDEDASIDVYLVTMDGHDVTELCDAAGIMEQIETLVWKGMADEVADEY